MFDLKPTARRSPAVAVHQDLLLECLWKLEELARLHELPLDELLNPVVVHCTADRVNVRVRVQTGMRDRGRGRVGFGVGLGAGRGSGSGSGSGCPVRSFEYALFISASTTVLEPVSGLTLPRLTAVSC